MAAFSDDIGFTILKYRKKSGLTQEQLASKMHVRRETIISWESGKTKPAYATVMQLAIILDIPSNEL